MNSQAQLKLKHETLSPDSSPLVHSEQRIPCLDGLRAVASLMILTYHFGPHITTDDSAFLLLRSVPEFFFGGVDLFFVLSGFLIAGILFDVRDSPDYYRTFYARRTLRLLPIYYLVCLGYVLLSQFPDGNPLRSSKLFENPLPAWAYFLHLQNVTMTLFNTFGPIWLAGSWSLAIEEQFYLVLPVLVRNMKIERLWKFAWGAFLFALVFRGLNQKFKFFPSMGTYVMPFARMDSLAAGVLVAYTVRYKAESILRLRHLLPRITMAAIALWLTYHYIPNPHSIRLAFVHHTVTATLFALILLSLVLHPHSLVSRFLSTRFMRNMGNLSYSMYLYHPIVLAATFYLMTGRDPKLHTPADCVWVAIAAFVTYALSHMSWVVIERPLQRIGHRFSYR